MTFMQIFRILWARRLWIIASVIGCFLVAAVVVKFMPKQFEAHSRVMLDVIKPDAVTGQTMPTNFARAYTATQTELIKDDRVAARVVRELGWLKNDSLRQAYREQATGNGPSYKEWLVGLISDNTGVDSIEASNIIDISYTSTSPEVARRIADAVRRAYVEQNIAFRREGAARNAEWFRNQAAQIQTQLQDAEQKKSAFEKANDIVLQDDYSDTASTRLRSLASQAPVPAMGAAPAMMAPGPSAAQLAQVDAQISAASQTLGPNHPEIVALRNQRAALAQSAAQERAAAIAAARASSATGPSISSEVAAQQKTVLAQRDELAELRKMQAKVEVLRDQYQKTMQRAADLTLVANSRDSGLTLLGAATAPGSPVSPKIGLILIGSLVLGLGLGLGVSLIFELLSRRVRGAEDLDEDLAPMIGMMPRSAEKNRLFPAFGRKQVAPA